MRRSKRTGSKGFRKPTLTQESHKVTLGSKSDEAKHWMPSEFHKQNPADLIMALVKPSAGYQKTEKGDKVSKVYEITVDARTPVVESSAFEPDALATQKKQLQVMASEVKDLQAEQERTRSQALQWLADQESAAQKAAALAEELGQATAKIALLEAERDAWLKEKETYRANNASLASELAQSKAQNSELVARADAMEEELDDLRMAQFFRHASGAGIMSSKEAYDLGCAHTKAKMAAAQPATASPTDSSGDTVAFAGFPAVASADCPKAAATELVSAANKNTDGGCTANMTAPAPIVEPMRSPQIVVSPTSGPLVAEAQGSGAAPLPPVKAAKMAAGTMSHPAGSQGPFHTGHQVPFNMGFRAPSYTGLQGPSNTGLQGPVNMGFQGPLHSGLQAPFTASPNQIYTPAVTGYHIPASFVVTPKLVRPGNKPSAVKKPTLLEMLQMPYEEGKAALAQARIPFRNNPAPAPAFFVVTPKCTNPGGAGGSKRLSGAKGWSTGPVLSFSK